MGKPYMTAAPPTKLGSLQCSLDGIIIVARDVFSSRSHDDSRAWQKRSVSASVTSHKLAITAGLNGCDHCAKRCG